MTVPQSDQRTTLRQAAQPTDGFLVAGVLGGDVSALRTLMKRYDPLVRYTIFRLSQSQCTRDPQWIDSIATETWHGLVRSVRRKPDDLPTSLAGYIVGIARNRCLTARRKLATPPEQLQSLSVTENDNIEAGTEDPSVIVEKWDSIAALRECVSELDESDQTLTSELPAITARKWRQAAEALEMSESTLRSRWARVVDALGRCVATKTGISLAPRRDRND